MAINPTSLASILSTLASSVSTPSSQAAPSTSAPSDPTTAVGPGNTTATRGPIATAFDETVKSLFGLQAPAQGTSTGDGPVRTALHAFVAALYGATDGSTVNPTGAPVTTGSSVYTGFETRVQNLIQAVENPPSGSTPSGKLATAFNNLVSAVQTAQGSSGTATTTPPTLLSFLNAFEQNLQTLGSAGSTAGTGNLVSGYA